MRSARAATGAELQAAPSSRSPPPCDERRLLVVLLHEPESMPGVSGMLKKAGAGSDGVVKQVLEWPTFKTC